MPRALTRSVGASVVLRNGELVAYLRRSNPNLQAFLPAEEPDRSTTARDLSLFLATLAQQDMERREDQRGGMLISTINGQPAAQHFLAPFLQDAGFHPALHGSQLSSRIVGRRRSQCLKATPSSVLLVLCTMLWLVTRSRLRDRICALGQRERSEPGGRADHRACGVARQVAAHPFFRRSHPGDTHADERQLAHLPSRRAVEAPAQPHADCACARLIFVAVAFDVPVARFTPRERCSDLQASRVWARCAEP